MLLPQCKLSASEHEGAYGDQPTRNLERVDFLGAIWSLWRTSNGVQMDVFGKLQDVLFSSESIMGSNGSFCRAFLGSMQVHMEATGEHQHLNS